MKIVCLGWGSLIWDPKNLKIEKDWLNDGPFLPIEFTRQSDNGRMTLILDRNAQPIQILWTPTTTDNLTEAIESLREREGVPNIESIHFIKATDEENDEIKTTIINWLKSKNFDAAIWTGLSYSRHTNFQQPSLENVLKYLKSIEGSTKELAEEYIRKAPKQIDTVYRKSIELELGWSHMS